jgi:photosystem II stability/assembly factor-like uncharacterized protein
MNHFIPRLRSLVPVPLVFVGIALLVTGFECDCSDPPEDPSPSEYTPPPPGGVIAESVDGGGSWVPLDDLFFAEAFYGGSFAGVPGHFVVGGKDTLNQPTIWTTTDSASTWQPTFAGTGSGAFEDIKLTSAGRLIAVSSGSGLICTSDDGGLSWVVRHSGGPFLKAVDFSAGTNIVIAVGFSGSIFRSADGGTSWIGVSSGTTQDLFGIHCFRNAATDTMIVVGAAGTVVRSTDAGLTWSPSTLPTSDILKAVSFSGNSVGRFGVAMGNSNRIFRTTNGGTTWQDKTGGTVGNIEDVIVSYDGTRSLAVFNQGSSASIQVSTDGGNSWGLASFVLNAYIFKLVPMDASLNSVIVAVGELYN